MRKSVEERFWERVDKTNRDDNCWVWLGSKDKDGYGHLMYKGRRWQGAHRVSWEMVNGEIPEGICICHECDHPWCVNPDHLFPGTSQDNTHDRMVKGRSAKGFCNGQYTHPEKRCRGEHHPRARYSWVEICEIRERFSAGGVTRGQLAREYSTDTTNITRILKGDVWKKPF